MDERWLLARPGEQLPFVLGEEAVVQGWAPPAGFSTLPAALRATIPESLQYWAIEDDATRRKVRDALVEALREGGLDLGLSKGVLSDDALEKRKHVPFNQWGGSAKCAPTSQATAGAQALRRTLLRERRAFLRQGTGRVIRPRGCRFRGGLRPQVHPAAGRPRVLRSLKRFSWTVSRGGYKRAKECEPKSDSERYGRLCAWGGRGQMSGYSTIHEGQSYDLKELWRFHEKLQGARLARKDWKDTVPDSDGAGTLFFLDPRPTLRRRVGTSRSVQRNDAARLIAAGNTHVADPAQIWGSSEVDDDLKLWGNCGSLFANGVQLYAHTNYASKKTTGGFYFRNPNTRDAVYTIDGGRTLLIGDVLDARDGVLDGSANCPVVTITNDVPDPSALDQVLANPNWRTSVESSAVGPRLRIRSPTSSPRSRCSSASSLPGRSNTPHRWYKHLADVFGRSEIAA